MRLKRQTAPGWVELHDGAALLCAPATTALVYAARAAATALLVDLIAAGEAVTKVGAHIEGMPDLGAPEQAEATRQSMFLISFAEMSAMDWRNVFDEDGQPIPFDPALLAQLLASPQAADAFTRNYLADRIEVATEANFS